MKLIMEDAIREGKRRYSECPRQFQSEEQAIKYAVAEWIWKEAEEWRDTESDETRHVLTLLQILTK